MIDISGLTDREAAAVNEMVALFLQNHETAQIKEVV